jgi:High potential iron-sulfur protein
METHDRQRRLLLRGALIAGYALALPALFAGCNRNKDQNSPEQGESGTTPSSEGTSGGGSSPGQGGGKGKVSKEAAKYQDRPQGDQQCSKCAHFVAQDNTCQKVEGQVSPNGWCALWAKKI